MQRLLFLVLAGLFSLRALSAQDSPAFPGSEAAAPWRMEAEKRIDQLRKGDLVVVVKDAKGEPVKDAAITVKQQRHAFPFSVVVDPAMFAQDSGEEPAAGKYRDEVAALFDLAHPPAEASGEAVENVRQWAVARGLLLPDPEKKYAEVTAELDPKNLAAPEDCLAALKAKAQGDGPIRLAAFAFPVDPASEAELQLQAFYTRDLFTAAFADARMGEIEVAQFRAAEGTGAGWAIFNADGSARPVGAMLRQLLRKTWWTEDGGLTNATGEWKGRAFRGDYRISASDGVRTKTVSASLSGEEVKVEITLADEPAPAPSATPE